MKVLRFSMTRLEPPMILCRKIQRSNTQPSCFIDQSPFQRWPFLLSDIDLRMTCEYVVSSSLMPLFYLFRNLISISSWLLLTRMSSHCPYSSPVVGTDARKQGVATPSIRSKTGASVTLLLLPRVLLSIARQMIESISN